MEGKESTPEELIAEEQARIPEQAMRNLIITTADPQRFPLLEMNSQPCGVPLSPAEEQAVGEMDDLLNALDEEAAGIAAVQIGVPRRIFLLRNGTNGDGEAENNVYINPTIMSKSRETKKGGEGCLSLPGMGAAFPRAKSVTLEYMDLAGEVHTETFTGFWARCVLHEVDHLNGRLITHHLEKEAMNQSRRSSWRGQPGMKLTPQRKKAIAKRRAKKKRSQASTRANKG